MVVVVVEGEREMVFWQALIFVVSDEKEMGDKNKIGGVSVTKNRFCTKIKEYSALQGRGGMCSQNGTTYPETSELMHSPWSSP